MHIKRIQIDNKNKEIDQHLMFVKDINLKHKERRSYIRKPTLHLIIHIRKYARL